MLVLPLETEDSEELKALALRFFSFNEHYWTERTKKYMKISEEAKDIRDDLDQMINIMCNHLPFNERALVSKHNYEWASDPVKQIQLQMNVFSLEVVFLEVFRQAEYKARWGGKDKTPHAEAAAWIAYFANWNKETNRFEYNQRWVEYYNQSHMEKRGK